MTDQRSPRSEVGILPDRESLTDAEQGALDHLIGLVPQATLSRTFRRDGQLYADVRVGNCLYVYEIAPRYRYRRVS